MKRKHLFPILFFCLTPTLPAQTPEELKSWLPIVNGWNLTEEIERFNPDNLFDRINGAAPLYIENNFREMTSLEYRAGADYITIQIYRHATPEDAFGMYASERSSDLEFVPIGGEAQRSTRSLFFFAGNVYVKMMASREDNTHSVLTFIAENLAEKIDSKADYPPAIKLFPTEGKVPYSELYVTSGYMGHDFLSSVYACVYKNEGETFQLFLIDGKSERGAINILEKYFLFTGQSEILSKNEFLIQDKYNGNIPVIRKKQYIIGIFNENGNSTKDAANRMTELSQKL